VNSAANSTSSLPVASRYFIAKYVPDSLRCEPRNVGVVLWTPTGAAARFVGERSDDSLDLRQAPPFVDDQQVYRQWVEYWRALIHPATGLTDLAGPLASIDETALTQSLGQASKAHWWLVPGGVLLDPVLPSEFPVVLERLFRELVMTNEILVPLESVHKIVTNVIRSLSLHQDPHFQVGVTLPTQSGAELHFDYGYVGKKVERLWQELPTMPKARQLELYATGTAFKFELAKSHFRLTPEQMCILICMTNAQEKTHREWLDLVGRYAQVHNVLDTRDRFNAFSDLPALDPLEGTAMSPGPVVLAPPKRRRSSK
jgi:hypothetical protein